MIRNPCCVHNRLFNADFEGKFKWTPDIKQATLFWNIYNSNIYQIWQLKMCLQIARLYADKSRYTIRWGEIADKRK
jgi:hypothetical protein